jgi:protein-tyrosine-phosphatase
METVRNVVAESAQQLSRGTVASFVPILAERFARERLRAQAQREGLLAKTAYEVLFVSLTGGGRAQIGAALLADRAGESVSVHSAGSHIASEIDANVRAVMEEVGIDLSDAFTKPLTSEVMSSADLVVTMGRSVGAISIPRATRHLDWRVGDPAGASLDETRRVREDIERRVRLLTTDLSVGSLAVAGLSAQSD